MGWISIITNLLLFSFKFMAGTVSGSIAITADAWHTLSDSLSSLVVVIGSIAASKKPDKQHPFGHGRAELVASLMIGFMLTLVAYHFLEEAIVRLQQKEVVSYGMLAYSAIISSVLFKEFLARLNLHFARLNNSSSLKADGWHHRSDSLSSLVILVGMVIGNKLWWIDSLLAGIVSIMILITAFEIIKEASDKLMGSAPSAEQIKAIKTICAENCDEELQPHHFHLHEYGDHREITFHIRFDGDIPLRKAHQIASKVEELVRKKLAVVATIHLESKE